MEEWHLPPCCSDLPAAALVPLSVPLLIKPAAPGCHAVQYDARYRSLNAACAKPTGDATVQDTFHLLLPTTQWLLLMQRARRQGAPSSSGPFDFMLQARLAIQGAIVHNSMREASPAPKRNRLAATAAAMRWATSRNARQINCAPKPNCCCCRTAADPHWQRCLVELCAAGRCASLAAPRRRWM
jgi:hypothetical protein